MNTKHLLPIIGIVAAIAVGLLIAISGSFGGVSFSGIPLFFACGLLAFLIQWLLFIPAFIKQTEKFFDLTGSITFISLALLAMYVNEMVSTPALLIGCMVIVWATRLGGFLFKRVQTAGHDRRFASIKPDFLLFLMTWTMQGLWVFFTFAAGLAAMTSGKSHEFDMYSVIGLAMWLAGFTLEIIADQQKSAFRSDPANAHRFISSGVWVWSRHPNYSGEILLWTGIAIAAVPFLQGWQYVTLLSPLFVFIQLRYVSGVRMLEARAKRKWQGDASYAAYRARTPMLLIKPWLKHDRVIDGVVG